MTYNIGGHRVDISLFLGDEILDKILPSFIPFKVEKGGDLPLFTLEVCESLEKVDESRCHLIRDVDTGNGITQVSKLNDGGYQFLINNVDGDLCAQVISDKFFKKCQCSLSGSPAMKRFALNNAVMLAYAFSSARHNTLLVHASVVRHNGVAYAFTAKSGTGKSTQVANWLRNIEGCDIVNDDNPIVRVIGNDVILYGSPWSGKTPCYRNINVPLAAIMLIKRDVKNFCVKMQPINAFSTVLTACSAMKWDEDLFQNVCTAVSKIVEKVKVAELHCLPDAKSAVVCRNFLEA